MARPTIRTIGAIKSGGRERLIWDGELRGLGIRVLQTGIKTFLIQYRTGAAHQRRIVLGRYGVPSPE